MAILREKLKSDQEKQEIINQKVNEAPIRPTQNESAVVQSVMEEVSEQFKKSIAEYGMTEQITEGIRKAVAKKCSELKLDYETRKRIERLAVVSVTGLGPIQPYMDDESVTEIVVQRYDNICIERNGKIEKVETSFISEEQLKTIINRIVQPVGRQINLHTPMVDARLADGSRVNATVPPVTPDGSTLTIRKFSKQALTGEDYIRLGSISPQMLSFLAECVKGKISLIVSGGTNTGKTTLLNMLSSYIPENELIITIEDSCELNLHQSNVRRMEARANHSDNMMPITIQALVKNSLRMRPDRIIVGEIRDGTIVDLMSSMSTGHEGSMSTVHANSPDNLVHSRIPILYGMNENVTFSEEAQNIQIVEALSLIVQIEHMLDGKRRITHITHVRGIQNGKVMLQDIFRYRQDLNQYEATGYIPEDLILKARHFGVEMDRSLFEREEEKT